MGLCRIRGQSGNRKDTSGAGISDRWEEPGPIHEDETHEARPGYAEEYGIIDYAGAGLKKRTVIRCSKAMRLSRSSFRNRIGLLQPMDIMNVMNIMRDLDQ